MENGESDVQKTPWHSWSDTDAILKELGTSLDGLSSKEAAERLQKCVAGRFCNSLDTHWHSVMQV